MNPEHMTQILKYQAMGVDELAADGSLTQIEWDTKGLVSGSRVVKFQSGTLGDAGTGGIVAIEVHASDTSGFTTSSSTKVREVASADLPAETDDNKIWLLEVGKNSGRYVRAVVTNASGDTSDVSVTGIGIPLEGPSTAAERGAEAYVSS